MENRICGGKSTYRKKNDNKLYEMANEYDELDKEWDEVEEVYREWIKTYNGGIKKIRKIMKRKGGRIPEKGKNGLRRIGEKKSNHRKKLRRIPKKGREWRKKELLNKEEYLKEQVYSYRIRNTHLKKTERIYNYFETYTVKKHQNTNNTYY
jgi:hypothetical protein